VVIPEGAHAADIVIGAIDDNLAEPTETVEIAVVPPACIAIYPPPRECYLVGEPSKAVAFIRDNEEHTTVSIVAIDAIGSEIPEVSPDQDRPQLSDPAVFRVTRRGALDIPLKVLYSVGGTALNGVDYVRIPGEITIPEGETSALIEINVLDDLLVEGTESVVITIQPPLCIPISPLPPQCYSVVMELGGGGGLTNGGPSVLVPGRAEARILDNYGWEPTAASPYRAAAKRRAIQGRGGYPDRRGYGGSGRLGGNGRVFRQRRQDRRIYN
jgi:hypothetical protein